MKPLFVMLGEAVTLPGPGCAQARWYAAEAVAGDYDNVAACGLPPVEGCSDPIAWRWREIAAGRDLDVATLSAGTWRVRASCTPLDGAADLALTTEVVVRAGDDAVGLASELIGVPFVLLPTRDASGRHQTDARLGADCIALVVYGQRRLGRDVPYMAPRALDRWTDVVDTPARGDVLDFGFQTALLAHDTAPVGVLDPTDRVLQTYHGLAEERALGSLPYATADVVVRRWRIPSGG